MEEDNRPEIVVVKGRGVVERIENLLEGFEKIETQGTTYGDGENKLVKVIILIEREERGSLFN